MLGSAENDPKPFLHPIIPHIESKRLQVLRKRKNVFSDETNRLLLRLLQRNTGLPDTLGNAPAVTSDLQLELAAAIRQRVLPWFWSISLHLILLILLMLWVYQVARLEPLDVLSGIANIPSPGDEHVIGPLGIGNGNVPNESEDHRNNSPADSTESESPNTVDRTTPGLVFGFGNGRNGAGGGGGQTDEAVLAGLRWLMKVQQPDGAWRFSARTFTQAATTQREDALAATAMALLAFQGFGVMPSSNHPLLEEFTRPVHRGWEWLLPQQNPDGSFFTERSEIKIHRFYTHALCTIALCERLVMTNDETLREPAQRAIDYCVRHQSLQRGGWRYLPDRFGTQSDVSVTGWIVLALKSGEAAGLTVPPDTYNRVMRFLDSMMLPSNHYMYREEEPMPSITMTAQASLCRMLLGWRQDNSRLVAGVRFMLDSPPSFAEHGKRDVYYWFFATQTLYHYGGNEWQTWNSMMRETLLQLQEKEGQEAGSWNPNQPARDAWAQYGRLYTTCMSIYILEVSYRHLRIFP